MQQSCIWDYTILNSICNSAGELVPDSEGVGSNPEWESTTKSTRIGTIQDSVIPNTTLLIKTCVNHSSTCSMVTVVRCWSHTRLETA